MTAGGRIASNRGDRKNGRLIGNRAVEVLHIDTVGSQSFFERLKVRPAEVASCTHILRAAFSKHCLAHGGHVEDWAGDGGYAFFPVKTRYGKSVAAALSFIEDADRLVRQTASTLGNRFPAEDVRRSFRIQAHLSKVYFDKLSRMRSALPSDLTSFLKHERDLVDFPDQLYITEQLYERLDPTERKKFEKVRSSAPYGLLTTSIWRRKREASRRARPILDGEVEAKDLTQKEWAFLKAHVLAQKMNAAARDTITTGLIDDIWSRRRHSIARQVLSRLTIETLYNYLRTIYPNIDFRLSLWRPAKSMLKKVLIYPLRSSPPRQVNSSDRRFAVVQCLLTGQPIVFPSVVGARHENVWTDIDPKTPAKTISMVQLPIYRTRSRIAIREKGTTMAVLSVHANYPDFFMREELAMWSDDLVGFLADLALAESLQNG
jgi:hypothetical protein